MYLQHTYLLVIYVLENAIKVHMNIKLRMCVVIIIQELSVDKIKLDEVNTLAKQLISQDHSGSTVIQQSLDELNAR